MDEVEQSEYCKAVLQCRIQEGHLPGGPIFSDVKSFTPTGGLKEDIEGWIGGFPCQAGMILD